MGAPAKTITPEETQETKAPETSQEASQNANPENNPEASQEGLRLEGKAAVAALVAEGKVIKGIKVLQATYSRRERDNHEYFTITGDKYVPQYVVDTETKEVTRVEKHSFRVSAIALRASLREIDVFNELTGILKDVPKAMERVLPGSTIDIVVREIPKDGIIRNYFTGEQRPAQHDTVVIDVIAATPSKSASRMAEDSMTMLLSGYYSR